MSDSKNEVAGPSQAIMALLELNRLLIAHLVQTGVVRGNELSEGIEAALKNHEGENYAGIIYTSILKLMREVANGAKVE